MADVRSWLLRPHAGADVIVCAKCHQSGDQSLYCIKSWILLATGIGSPDGVEQFSQADTQVNIHYCGNLLFDVVPLSVMTSRLPGSLKQMRGSGCLSWQSNDCIVSFGAHFVATIHLKLIGFNAIESLQSKNTCALTEALRHHKHLSTSLIAVGAIIIDKSFDKLVKTRGVKVSMKGWRDGSQTQWAQRVWHGLCRGHCDFGRGPHYRTVFARWAIQTPTDTPPPPRHQHSRAHKPAVLHYELPMEKKVPWNGAVSMRSRAGSWETLSICITLRHNQGAPADMHANALGFLIICRFPLP